WDLEAIDAEYQAFTKTYEGTGQRLADAGNRPQTSFETYIPMLTQWRRLPYRDPGLPAELLPATWHGYRAHTLFAELDALIREPAQRHAMLIIHRSAAGGGLPRAIGKTPTTGRANAYLQPSELVVTIKS